MFCITLAIILPFLKHVNSHAALLEPPARNVMYRMGFPSAPYHENDDYLVCVETGSIICPPCGDSLDAQYPRPHEAGGLFATGTISRSYVAGQEIEIYVNVTMSHGGHIELKLCPNNDIYHPVEQGCLDLYPLQVAGKRTSRIPVTSPYGGKEEIRTIVKLPEGLTCHQCVLQMSFNTDQYLPSRVLFRNCADIEIVSNDLPEATHPATQQPIATQRDEVYKPRATQRGEEYQQSWATQRDEEYQQPPATQRAREYKPRDTQRDEEYQQPPATQRAREYKPRASQRDEEYQQPPATQRAREYKPRASQRDEEYQQPLATQRAREYNPRDTQRDDEYQQPSATQNYEEYHQAPAPQGNEEVLEFHSTDVEALPSGYSRWGEQRGHVTPFRSRFPNETEKFSHRFSEKYK